MEFLIVSGLSGAGKGVVKSQLSDIGYFAVDNMPCALLPEMSHWCDEKAARPRKVVLVADIRGGDDFAVSLFAAMHDLKEQGHTCRLLFVEADLSYIQRRYKETRRRHPLQVEGRSIADSVEKERELLEPLRTAADLALNATALSAAQVRERLLALLNKEPTPLPVTIETFGFKYGLPQEADLVFDVRFLPNPYYIPELRPLTGLDDPIRQYVMSFAQSQTFLTCLYEMLAFLLPHYQAEGKSELTIGIGCTGGKHRSVTLACELYRTIKEMGYSVSLRHRDIGK